MAGRSTVPGDVVDAHVHLFARGLFLEQVERGRALPEPLARALETRRLGRRGEPLPDLAPEEMAAWYAHRLDEAGIAKAVVMSVFEDSEYMRRFVRAAAGRIFALTTLDPTASGAAVLLEREMAAGFRGVKLLPVNRHFYLSDPACRPFFEKAAELACPITVHYGVTIGPTGDLRYADPTDLSPVARDFPEITFVIAHFGAGYFSETLRLAYQCDNVCVDSSGTNNWMDYDPHGFTLAQVFERALLALGPERILFGTDSGTTAPYRSWIAYQQRRTLEEIGLGERERDTILRRNAVRIFSLDEEELR
ncbi:amidohydrolase family protein [Coriobacteriia bacterium Es71-Z0120]|uniref:amidohydrolase family protein n=1 Tax=Parvivirga hydrogeniphila TaxID=2939460 RepID=UPI002260B963|nr:amidohydrolase family protein [Parvivirga hydrogeniphila]MCL4078224.1 amidohydrolase family protein [Parvivirga hydrogeniphila]